MKRRDQARFSKQNVKKRSNHILDLFFLDPNAGDTGVEDFDDDNNKKKGKTEGELLLLTSSCIPPIVPVYLLVQYCIGWHPL